MYDGSNNCNTSGIMKKILLGAVFIGAFFVVMGSVQSTVLDKRAPGVAGDKTYQVLISTPFLGVHGGLWVPVTEGQWDRCEVGDGALCAR